MSLLCKLAFKPSLLLAITSVIELSSKQNCFAKSLLFDQAMLSIIDNFSNISATTTNLDKNTDTNIINVDNNKFYNYLAYFFILFDLWPF